MATEAEYVCTTGFRTVGTMLYSRLVSPSVRTFMWPALFALAACNGGGSPPAPVAVADSYVFNGTQALTISAPGVLSNDSGSAMSAVQVTGPAQGTLTLNPNGSFTYTSSNGTSNDSFTYKATDASGSSSVVTVSLAPKQAPVANNACTSTPVGTSVNGTLTATDNATPAQPDTFTLVSDPAIGPYKGQVSLNQNTGAFTYIPFNSSYVGMDKFKFQVTDTFGGTSTAIVTVLVNGAVRIMPLGDSITQGVWYSSSTNACNDPINSNCPAPGVRVSYRQKLYNDLEALSPKYAVNMVGSLSNGVDAGLTQPNHEGHPGDTALQIANGDPGNGGTVVGLSTWLTANPPDIILLHIGTNLFSVSSYPDVGTILDNINSWVHATYPTLPSGSYPVTVFVARIIQDVNGTNNVTLFNDDVQAMITTGIAAPPRWPYLRVMPTLVNEQTGAGLVYTIDITTPCLDGTGTCSGDMASDLHPNPSGYLKMAAQWETDLKAASGVLPTCP